MSRRKVDDEAEEIANPRLAFALRHARPLSSSPPDNWGEIDAALLEETRCRSRPCCDLAGEFGVLLNISPPQAL